MMRAFRSSLSARVLASNMVFATATIATISTLFLWTYNRDLDRQLASRAAALAVFLAGQSQFAMLVGDRAELERIAANAVATDDVVFLELDDAQGGNPVIRRDEGGAGAPLIEVTRKVMRPPQGHTEWESGAATGESQQLGTVRLGFSTAAERMARLRFAGITAAIAVISLLFAAVQQVLQLRKLLRPGLSRISRIVWLPAI